MIIKPSVHNNGSGGPEALKLSKHTPFQAVVGWFVSSGNWKVRGNGS